VHLTRPTLVRPLTDACPIDRRYMLVLCGCTMLYTLLIYHSTDIYVLCETSNYDGAPRRDRVLYVLLNQHELSRLRPTAWRRSAR